MRRASTIAILAFAVLALAGIARAQAPDPGKKVRIPDKPAPRAPIPPHVPDEADPFWEHPYGDEKVVPCAHMQAQHAGGDLAPCPCPPIVQHAGGDDKKVDCVHKKLEHPDGDDTGKKGPCQHIKNGVPEHKNDPIMAPCTHWTVEHKDGDTVKVPCTHVSKKHPGGEPGTSVPCTHLVPKHPEGHKELAPCSHILPLVRQVADPPVDFYTDDAKVQAELLAALEKLRGLGVKYRWPRPLGVFFREPIGGDPDKGSDPFWHHYGPTQNVLVITRDPEAYVKNVKLGEDQTLEQWKTSRQRRRTFAVSHELGHALVGSSCVRIKTPGGEHTMMSDTDEGLAMSEGWGHFVSAVINNSRDSADAMIEKYNLENGQTTDGPYSEKVEFRVACILWDLFDKRAEQNGDGLSLEFTALFGVFSPTFQTLTNGPEIPSLADFCSRLKKNNPGNDAAIDQIRKFNTTKP